MTNDDGFLQAILASPDDDTSRLAYADWLEEHGRSERAAFIRVQCQLALLTGDDPRRAELQARERQLLQEHEEEWVGAFGGPVKGWVFHRGMAGVGVDVPQFLAHAQALARSPYVHYIDVRDHAVGRANLLALADSPHLARVTILDLAGWYTYDSPADLVDDEQAAALAGSPHVSGLTALNLRCNDIGDAGVHALAGSPYLARLTELDLRANPFGDRGLLALACTPGLTGLLDLDLSHADGAATEAGWLGLTATTGLAGLRTLSLYGNPISDPARQALRARFGDRVHF
jgi:uncharacterized protein (TIGR02996 family)